ncbi:MAG: hypothetical protein GXO85_12505 [Chlorobi bacterium]|nr:hypothetical protein [Chlorobiota bacterium]
MRILEYYRIKQYYYIGFLIPLLVCLFPDSIEAAILSSNSLKFEISITPELYKKPLNGRLLLIITKNNTSEPRTQINWQNGAPFFGINVKNLGSRESIIITDTVPGYLCQSLRDIPVGDYYVQALLNVYTEFHRSDGHVIFAHMDQWEGQHLERSPGNLISNVQKVHLDPSTPYTIKIVLSKKLPPIEMPKDTEWVKRIKIKSKLLTKFWGHPIYIGATILLPKNYTKDTNTYYPVNYDQGHFETNAPYGFSVLPNKHDMDGHELYTKWILDSFPRMVCVTFQHPTPYYDDSYAVNSVNNGPYGDAIMNELIPYIETKFRIIRKPYARILSGGSTGGWEALALQLYYPDFFGGAWVFYPDPIDFHFYGLLDIYNDDNAFTIPKGDWRKIERPMNRDKFGQPLNTLKEMSHFEQVLGSRDRSGGQLAIWEATFCPVDNDGYPKHLWDPITGEIDHTVSDYMREQNYDLLYYLKTNWDKLGPKLVDKLHFYCGDMDGYYLNLGVYAIEKFLENTKNPYYNGSFEYGRPIEGHGWNPLSSSQTIEIMDSYIKAHKPKNEN